MSAADQSSALLERAAGRVRRRLVPFLFLLYIFAYLDRINVGFASLQMNAAVGLSAAAYGFGAGIFFFSYTAFEVPSNIILARVGARRWIARIMITWGAVSAAMMFTRGPLSFYALRFLLGLAEAGFFPGIIYYLTRWVPARERARTVAAFMTAVLMAGIIGGPISGALLTMHGVGGLAGWQWLFLLEGIPAIVLGVVVLFVLEEGPAQADWLPADEKAVLVARLAFEERATSSLPGGHSPLTALANGRVWLLAVVYFAVPLALYAMGFFLPQIIQASYGGGSFGIGVLSALPYLAGVTAMVLAARHSDATGERRWHVAVGAIVCGLGMLASAWTSGLVSSLIALSIAMAGLAAMLGPFWTLATSFVQGAAAAAGIALINSVANIGGFIGPYLLGALKDRTGGFAAGSLVIGAIVIACGLVVLALPDSAPTEPSIGPE